VDIRDHNRRAWNKKVELGNPWTVPVSSDVIRAARRGQWSILLTPNKPVPREWFPDVEGANVLCLASAGGQQGPILAAAGAIVTVFDNSLAQLDQDRLVAKREQLQVQTIEGDMADLSVLSDASFDLVVNPVSNVFVPDVHPVWREAYRVLGSKGVLMAGFNNPVLYMFDVELMTETGKLEVKHSLPYSDTDHLSEEKIRRADEYGSPLEFSHTLEDQIGGQIDAGFLITGFYEDHDRKGQETPLSRYMPTYIATRAVKP
jgi:SAM-dependent methyltransferase